MKIGFIGCGNMGSALARAVASLGTHELYLADYDVAKAEALAAELGARVLDNSEVARVSDYLFLAVKPDKVREVLSALPTFGATLVSMAAGVSVAALGDALGKEMPIIRIMPNTPVSVGEGAVLYCSNAAAEARLSDFCDILKNAGRLIPLDERYIDAGSALSGCGPAFVYLFAEALADGAVLAGLPRKEAGLLAAQTLIGAGKLLLESGKHPGELKDAVCSPGGTTIEGIRALEDGGFRACAMNAVIAAYEKTKKLMK